jgi:hypothetical protein
VAEEIRYKALPDKAMEIVNTIFGKRFAREDDFEKQFLYGLNVLFAGFEVV